MDEPQPPVDPSHSALIIHDMQKDYLGYADSRPEHLHYAVERVSELRELAHEIGMDVIYTLGDTDPRVGVPEDRKEYLPPIEESTCLRGTEGAEVVEELTPTEDDFVITKYRSSSFYNTNLDAILRTRNDWVLVLAGGSVDWGIEWIGRDARPRFMIPIVLEDCVYTSRGEDTKQASFANFERFMGHVAHSDDIEAEMAEYK